jgi:hypothetical protein
MRQPHKLRTFLWSVDLTGCFIEKLLEIDLPPRLKPPKKTQTTPFISTNNGFSGIVSIWLPKSLKRQFTLLLYASIHTSEEDLLLTPQQK